MGESRDNFSNPLKRLLCDRVGSLCSKPDCRTVTKGPAAGQGAKNIGRACHIHAASKGGPRYDPNQTPEQRSAHENGIWLCANHGAEVDSDHPAFTPETLRQWKDDAETFAEQRFGKGAVGAPGPARNAQLIAIGPNVLANGIVVRTERATWTLELDSFLLGDVVDLRRYIETFANLAMEDCFVCLEADGVGRTLVDAPIVDLASGTIRVELHVAAPMPQHEARELFDANELGDDLAMDLSGDEPDLDPAMKTISGADRIPQSLMICLSTCKGGYTIGSEHGSRIAEWNAKLGSALLTRLIAMETIRLATAAHFDSYTKRQYVPFNFIERVRDVRLLPTTSTGFIKAGISLDVYGLNGTREFVVPISLSTEPLGERPTLAISLDP